MVAAKGPREGPQQRVFVDRAERIAGQAAGPAAGAHERHAPAGEVLRVFRRVSHHDHRGENLPCAGACGLTFGAPGRLLGGRSLFLAPTVVVFFALQTVLLF